jgi:hypothetical protein
MVGTSSAACVATRVPIVGTSVEGTAVGTCVAASASIVGILSVTGTVGTLSMAWAPGDVGEGNSVGTGMSVGEDSAPRTEEASPALAAEP